MESLIMIAVILIFFLLAVAVASQIRFSADSISNGALNELECNRLAGLIQESFIQGIGTQAGLNMNNASAVSLHAVKVNDSVCDFSASVTPVSLNAGHVLVKNISGTITVVNG